MGLPLRDYRFATPVEKEHDRAYTEAMKQMRNPCSDEAQMLCEAAVDDMSDLRVLASFWVSYRDAAACETLLAQLFDRHVERVAQDEAEKACETVPSDPHETYGISRGAL